MNWPTDIVQFLGITTVITAGAAWLARELVKAGLGRDLERHKAYLQAINQERQILFASLHKERAELLRELYRTLPTLAHKVLRIGQQLSRHPDTMSDSGLAVETAATEFGRLRELYGMNRILLPESLCRKIDDLFNLISVAFEAGAQPGKAVQLSRQFAAVQVALEKEFRSMLGVESEPSERPTRGLFGALRRRPTA